MMMMNDAAIQDIKVEDEEICELTHAVVVHRNDRIHDPADLDSMEPTNLSTKDRPSEERR